MVCEKSCVMKRKDGDIQYSKDKRVATCPMCKMEYTFEHVFGKLMLVKKEQQQ